MSTPTAAIVTALVFGQGCVTPARAWAGNRAPLGTTGRHVTARYSIKASSRAAGTGGASAGPTAAGSGPRLATAAALGGVVAAAAAKGAMQPRPKAIRRFRPTGFGAGAEVSVEKELEKQRAELERELRKSKKAEKAPQEPREGWLARRRRMKETKLFEELSDLRQLSKRLRAEIEAREAENTARLNHTTEELAAARAREAALTQRLQEVLANTEALEAEAAELIAKPIMDDSHLAPLVEEQNETLRKVLDVVDGLERQEAELESQLSQCRDINGQLKEDLLSAERECEAYFETRQLRTMSGSAP